MNNLLISHYLKITIRMLTLNKLYSLINLFGLAVGFAACIFITVFVRFELSYDNWVANSENIYRYENFITNPGSPPFYAANTPFIIRQHLIDNFPEMEQVARLMDVDYATRVGDKNFIETIAFTDENFLQIFDFPLLQGNTKTALYDNNSIIISKKMAEKYFGNDDPLGKTINLNNLRDYTVAGVLKNLPRNSHLNINFIVKYNPLEENFGPGYHENWYGNRPFTYLTLKNKTDPESVRDKLSDFFDRIAPMPFGDTGPKPSEFTSPRIKKLKDIHLAKNVSVSKIMHPTGDKNIIYAFIGNAFLILIIASINFINLSTARSFKRTKEIAIRKVVGANRNQIIRQFIGETITLTFIAFFLALVMVEITLPIYNNFLGLNLKFSPFSDMPNLPMIVLIILTVGTISGLYAAYIASSVRPADGLKTTQINTTSGSQYFRTTLIIFQFSITIALCIATSVIFAQQRFIESRDLGYSSAQKVIIRDTDRDYSHDVHQTLENEIRKISSVKNTAFSNRVPVDTNGGWSSVYIQGYVEDEKTGLFRNSIDYNFFKTYNIPILAGRDFSKQRNVDEFEFLDQGQEREVNGTIILNQGAVKRIGFKNNQEALGKTLFFGGADSNYHMEIIGIIPDVNFISLRNEVRQGMYFIAPNRFQNLTVQFEDAALISIEMQKIEKIWNRLIPNNPLNYEILEDNIHNQYSDIRNQSQVMMAFSLLSITIACLGLYAITYFTAEQRTKEIAIRKVHGAQIPDILKLLLTQLSKPILIANIIAYPVAFFFMTEYLNDFTFRIDLSINYFLITTIATLCIAISTVIWHAIKTAKARAIYALNNE